MCSCGWEDRKGRGIQEGYICALSKKGFGFISEDGSSGRGIYFHQSDVKGAINWVQLSLGMYVHFKVCENDKGCIAKEVSVIAQVGGLFVFVLCFSKAVLQQFKFYYHASNVV